MTAQKIRRLLGPDDGGFTLIELLIVMAILGVLAVVVLVAINPLQQLARGRDTGRISSVAQLGHALEAYYTAHDATYPTVAQWTPVANNVLVTSGEINQVPGLVANSVTAVCTSSNVQGWCYNNTPVTAFVVYSRLEALTNRTLGTCVETTPSFITYASTRGRACIVCQAGEPTAAAPGTCVN